MSFHHLNFLAVLAAALSTMLVGFLWYSPLPFAKPWMKEMGYDTNDTSKAGERTKFAGYAGSLAASVVSAFVLALFLHWFRAETAYAGALVGFHAWVGFVATVQFTGALFTRQSMKVFAINTGYQLLCYLVMGAILGAWR